MPQFGLIREATHAFNVPCIEQEGFEADDIIATYARIAAAEGFEVVIVSSDKDLMQLVREGVGMFDPIKSRAIGVAEVRARFGVDPDRVVDVQALAGDATDNVPGVRGIGVKTAATLINDYGDLDTVLARAGEIKQPKRRQLLIESADDARLSRELVRLREDVPVDGDIEALAATPPDPEVLLSFLGAMEFTKLAERLRPRFEAAVGPPVAAAARLTETPTYQLVATIEDLAAFVALARASGTVAIAVQADSPRPMRARLVGIALSPPPPGARSTCRSFATASPTSSRWLKRPERWRRRRRCHCSNRCWRTPPSSRSATTSRTTCTCWPATASCSARSTTRCCCPSCSAPGRMAIPSRRSRGASSTLRAWSIRRSPAAGASSSVSTRCRSMARSPMRARKRTLSAVLAPSSSRGSWPNISSTSMNRSSGR